MLATVLSVVAVLTGLGSLWFTDKQWQKVKKKIGMIDDAGEALEILPAWYTERMMNDQWQFGLLTTSGVTIAISNIEAMSDDGKWMDVSLLTDDEVPNIKGVNFVTAIADDRRQASIQISEILMAYDIVTS
jgi:hypothetical protein